MSADNSPAGAWLIVCLGCFSAGFLVADLLNHRETVEPVARAEVRTSRGDVQPAKVPNGRPALPAPTVPLGAARRDVVEVTITPDPVSLPARDVEGVRCPAEVVRCPAVPLRLDLATEVDGQTTAAVRAQGATVGDSRYLPQTDTAAHRDKRITGILLPGSGWLVVGTQDYGRWAVGVAGGNVDGSAYAGLAASISIR
jgi:hypothetical protein